MIFGFGVRGILLVLVLAGCQSASQPPCHCGPDFCLRDPRYPPMLDEKKRNMRRDGFPPELIALMDRDGACVARVERAPDIFSIKLVKAGENETIAWTPEDERIARNDLMTGNLKAYYKFNVSRAFSCCDEPRYDQRQDWDDSLQLNTGLAIACKKTGTQVTCQ